MRRLGIWQVESTQLTRVEGATIEFERQLEEWIAQDPALLQEGLVVVGRQTQLDSGALDLLALDPQGRWVVIEIKRGTVDRKTVAQVLDYAACVAELSAADLRSKIESFLSGSGHELDELLKQRGAPDALDAEQRELLLFVVGTGRAPGLERVIRFLAGRHGMPISVVLFDVFRLGDGRLLLAREVADEESTDATRKTGQPSVTVEDVLTRAARHGTEKQLRRMLELAHRKGLHVRPWKKSLMFTPPSNRTRTLFTLWVEPPEEGKLQAWVGNDPFIEFFPLERAHVEKLLGREGWRKLSDADFDELLQGLEALDLQTDSSSGSDDREDD